MAEPVIETTRLFVRALRVVASIGIHPHERIAPQPLILDVEMDVPPVAADRIGATYDYALVRDAAHAVIADGHIDLVETFAERIARRLFGAGDVEVVRIRVAKPAALVPDAETAGVELRMRRG
ncbi:dihydroneopterin aldolase [Flavisphingomonas formosensis]|uniref:dihydroneopterin aldolase n=1 Tax=Flavisphingomonas formosensis TaxID=861534 RepID=UPI001E3F2509|nr:dihydroneopterin aldolase [Sphingomonas formosensis]